MVNTVVIPFFDIEVSVNTLLGIALFLIIFFTFFSVSFEMHIGEGDDTNVACNRRKPGETDGDGVARLGVAKVKSKSEGNLHLYRYSRTVPLYTM